MNTLSKRITIGIVVTVLLLAFGAVAGYAQTSSTPAVPATVDTDPTLPHITLGENRFHSATFGDPENQALIVLHGGPGGDYRALLVLEALADDYFVIFYDQRGSGLSTRIGADALTTQDMIDDLDLFVEHFSPDQPVYLIGHSWGAMLASAYIGQHPEKAAKVVLAEPGMLTDEALAVFQERMVSIIDGQFIAAITPVMIGSTQIVDAVERADYVTAQQTMLWVADADNPYVCPGQTADYPYWRMGAAVSQAIATQFGSDGGMAPFNENAHHYTASVLFLASECNTWLGADLQQRHAALFPSAEVVVIAGAGHYMFNDNLEDSLAAVRAYFSP